MRWTGGVEDDADNRAQVAAAPVTSPAVVCQALRRAGCTIEPASTPRRRGRRVGEPSPCAAVLGDPSDLDDLGARCDRALTTRRPVPRGRRPRPDVDRDDVVGLHGPRAGAGRDDLHAVPAQPGRRARVVQVWDADAVEPWRSPYARSLWHLPMPDGDLDDLRSGRCASAASSRSRAYRLPTRTATPSPSTCATRRSWRRNDGGRSAASATSTSCAGSRVTLRLGGRGVAVDCLAVRDRSWYVRDDLRSMRSGYTYGAVDGGEHFLAFSRPGRGGRRATTTSSSAATSCATARRPTSARARAGSCAPARAPRRDRDRRHRRPGPPPRRTRHGDGVAGQPVDARDVRLDEHRRLGHRRAARPRRGPRRLVARPAGPPAPRRRRTDDDPGVGGRTSPPLAQRGARRGGDDRRRCEAENLGAGLGLLGEVTRLHLTYAGGRRWPGDAHRQVASRRRRRTASSPRSWASTTGRSTSTRSPGRSPSGCRAATTPTSPPRARRSCSCSRRSPAPARSTRSPARDAARRRGHRRPGRRPARGVLGHDDLHALEWLPPINTPLFLAAGALAEQKLPAYLSTGRARLPDEVAGVRRRR